jgi:signal transduction histidine kinase
MRLVHDVSGGTAAMLPRSATASDEACAHAVLLAQERIARALHDTVVQDLFGVALSLQAVLPLVTDDRVAARLTAAVDQLDRTVCQVREVAFGLEVRLEE